MQGESRVVQIAGVERLLEGEVRGLQIVLAEIRRQLIRNDDGVVALVEVGEVAAIFVEARQYLPAQTVAQRQPAVYLILILREEAVLCGRTADVRA